MNSNKKFLTNRQSRLLRSLVATAFIANGFFPLAPAFAGATTISNTATAEYDDPGNPSGPKIPATSNTVTVTVDEIVGITLTAQTPTDVNGGTVQIGDALIYGFTIANTGNDPTTFRIPNAVTVTGPGTVSGSLPNSGTPGNLQYSTNSTNGVDGTWTTLSTPEAFTPSIAVGATVRVRVPITVTNAAPGTNITVTLGDTSNNTVTTQNQQNVLLQPSGSIGAKDVYTKDNLDTVAGETPGVIPIAQEKEAAATGTTAIGNKEYALATVLKTQGAYNNQGTQSITDDTLAYNLSFRVENTAPSGITPVPLQGTSGISVNGIAGTYILVSDAIPKDTQLSAAPTATDTTNWEPVYTTDPADTGVAGYKNANAALWKKFPLQGADTLVGVTRIGFINKIAGYSVPANGTPVTGFSVTVKVKGTPSAPLTIANIAQLFGASKPTNVADPSLPVYDESGDQRPSNYNGTIFPGTDTNGDGVPDTLPPASVDDGYINTPSSPETGTDSTGNNTGDTTDLGGEANVFIINTFALLNGPNGQPAAVGPTNNNDDFTNKSAIVPANTAPGTTINPAAVTFTNTVRNDGSQPANISLLPTPPSTAGDLLNGTTVLITSGGASATYTYSGTAFTFTSGTGTVGGNPVSGTNPVRIDAVAASGGIGSYTVSVDLPAGTSLSTDTSKGYPVPIIGFIDSNSNGLADDATTNTTIDRVYTGFLRLVKYSRILDSTGAVLTGARATQSDFETTPVVGTGTSTPRNPLAGEIIEYEIRYKNIVAETTGTNNINLSVTNLVITEDGTGPNGNWASDQNSNGVIDTSNVAGSAVDSVPASATITYFSGSPATTPATAATTGTLQTTDVTKYINSISVQLAPGSPVRTFNFKRKVN